MGRGRDCDMVYLGEFGIWYYLRARWRPSTKSLIPRVGGPV